MKDTDWQVDALCPQVDNELFFPEQGGSGAHEAKQVCGLCPVMNECRLWALETGMAYGIFGGLSPDDRTRLRPAYAEEYGWDPLPGDRYPAGGSKVDAFLGTPIGATIAGSLTAPRHARSETIDQMVVV